MEIELNPAKQHVVFVTPGLPLHLVGGVSIDRAVAECSLCGVLAAGNAQVVIDIAVEHNTDA